MGVIICAINCDQYILIQLFGYLYYFSLLFIIFHYFTLVHIRLWHCFMMVEYMFHLNICVVVFLWGPQTIWFVILHLGNTTHKIGGGVCVTQWDWGHLKSPFFTIYTFGFISSQTLNYISTNNSYILSLFSIEFPALVFGISAVFHVIHHCTVVETLIFIFLRYMFDPFTCSSNHPYVWVICFATTHWGVTYIGVICLYTVCCPLVSFSEARWLV